MKKINIYWLILDSLFLIAFNFVFFLTDIGRGPSVMISYGFMHFAYLMLILTPFLIRKGKSAAVFGFTLYSISTAYFIVELITGFIFILLQQRGYKTALIVQFIIAILYGIVLVTNMIANESTADAEEERQSQIDYIKKASARLEILVKNAKDGEIKKKLEKVYDEFCSSPVKSHPSLQQMEKRIMESIEEFEDVVASGNKEKIFSLSDTLLGTIKERNTRLKNLN